MKNGSDPFGAAFESILRPLFEEMLQEHRAAIRADMRKALAELTADASPETEGGYDSRKAAAYLDVSTRTLARLKKAGEIPYARCGRQIRYRKADLDAYLASNIEP